VSAPSESREPVELLRSFRAELQSKREGLVEAATFDPRVRKVLSRLDVVLALIDDAYRGLLH
jgi:hypothetical protein